MEIHIESLIEGAQRARGTVVIVDVFRAFTTAAIAFVRGADKIIMVAEPDTALSLREQGVGDLCMGEVDGRPPPDFDFGNSPSELSRADLDGTVLIQSTRAGTVGVTSVHHAEALYVASFVVARATAACILLDTPPLVTIVSMGSKGISRADEDESCALYLRNLLERRCQNHDAIRRLVLSSAAAGKYRDPALPHYPPEDCEIALQIDSVDFAMQVTREDGLCVARPHHVTDDQLRSLSDTSSTGHKSQRVSNS